MERREAVAETLEEVEEFELECVNDEGDSYIGRLTGQLLADYELGGWNVYLTKDERTLLHDENEGSIVEIEPHMIDLTLGSRLDTSRYMQAMVALGEKPVVDL